MPQIIFPLPLYRQLHRPRLCGIKALAACPRGGMVDTGDLKVLVNLIFNIYLQ